MPIYTFDDLEIESPRDLSDDELMELRGQRSASAQAGDILRGAAKGVLAPVRLAGAIADTIRAAVPTGPELGVGGEKSALTAFSEWATKAVEKFAPPPVVPTFGSNVREGIGQVVSSLAGGVTAGLARKGMGVAGAVTMGASVETMDAFDAELERQRSTGEQTDYTKALAKAGVYGVGATALEGTLGVGRLFAKFEKAVGAASMPALLKQVVKNTPGNAVANFTEETLQRALQDMVVEGKINPIASLYEGAVGGTVGALVGGAGDVATGVVRRPTDTVPRTGTYDFLGGDTSEAQRQEGLQVVPSGPESVGGLALSGPSLLRSKEKSGFAPTAQVDATQMMGRLRNKLAPAEVKWYEDAGLQQWLQEEKRTSEATAKWMEENGPKVEVRVFGGKATDLMAERRQNVAHQLDTMRPDWRNLTEDEVAAMPNAFRTLWAEYNDPDFDTYETEADNVYQDTAPTKTPVKVLMVRVPWESEKLEGKTYTGPKGRLYEGPHFGSEDVNVLGFSRYQVETLPSGEKVMHVIEVQSDWNADLEDVKSGKTEGPIANHPLLRDYNRLVLKALVEQARKEGVERIVVSDAETAMMSEGHDLARMLVESISPKAIPLMWGGAEQTRSSFGDDWQEGKYVRIRTRSPQVYRVDKPEKNQRHDVEFARAVAPYAEKGGDYIPQEPGMRLNYDTILPKIMRELTGDTGEKVTVGEHQRALMERRDLNKAFDADKRAEAEAYAAQYPGSHIEEARLGGSNALHHYQVVVPPQPRQNLIFREGDKPKTSSTGLAFRLPQRTKPFALFGKNLVPAISFAEAAAGLDAHGRATMQSLGLREGATAATVLDAIGTNEWLPSDVRELAKFLSRHFKGMLEAKVQVLPGGGSAFFSTVDSTVNLPVNRLDGPQQLVAGMLLHEVAHSVTVAAIRNPTEAQRAAVETLKQGFARARAALSTAEQAQLNGMIRARQDLMTALRENKTAIAQDFFAKHGIAGLPVDLQLKLYHLTSLEEFVAGVFNVRDFRGWLNTLEMGNRSLLQRMIDMVFKLLGVDRTSTLANTLQGLIDLSEAMREEHPVAKFDSAVLPSFMPTGTTPNDILPDRPPVADVNDVTAQLYGTEKLAKELVRLAKKAGKVGEYAAKWIEWLQGGKARINSEEMLALATYAFERHGVAPAIASAIGETLKGRINKVFKPSKTGDLAVVPNAGYTSLKTSDVFGALRDNANAYQLTAEQQDAWVELKALMDRVEQLILQYKIVDKKSLKSEYFFRRVLEVPNLPDVKSSGGISVGRIPPLAKERFFETEAEGWSKGYVYETDIEKLITSSVQDIYESIAAKRLVANPLMHWTTLRRLTRAMLQEAVIQKGSPLTPDESARIKKRAKFAAAKMRVHSAQAFEGKLFDPQTAAMINKEFAAEQSRWRQAVVKTSSALKGLRFGLDLGVHAIQMLPTLFANPVVWGRSLAYGIASMGSPKVFANFVREHHEAVMELAEQGTPVGRLPEHLSGLQKGEVLTKVPLLGPVVKMFGREFQSTLDTAKVYLWEAKTAGKTLSAKEKQQLARSIESQLLLGRAESGFLTHDRAMAERVLFLAPSYYRGAVEFVAGLASGGKIGRAQAFALSKFLAGTALMYWVVGKQLGMDDDELKRRLDPTVSEFMLWNVKDGEQTLNFGVGGLYRSMTRLLGQLWKAVNEHGVDDKFWFSKENPLVRWYRGHSNPLIGEVWSFLTGKDYGGDEMSGFSAAGKAVMPVGWTGASKLERGVTLAGLTAFPEGTRQFEQRRIRETSEKPIESMRYGERVQAARRVAPEVQRFKEAQPEQAAKRSAVYAVEKMEERTQRIREELPADMRQWIERNKVKVAGYQTSFVEGRTQVPLLNKEFDKLHQLMLKEYEAGLKRLMAQQSFESAPSVAKQKRVETVLELARRRARAAFRREVGTKAD